MARHLQIHPQRIRQGILRQTFWIRSNRSSVFEKPKDCFLFATTASELASSRDLPWVSPGTGPDILRWIALHISNPDVGLETNFICKAAMRAACQTSQPCSRPTFCRSGVQFQALAGTKSKNPTLDQPAHGFRPAPRQRSLTDTPRQQMQTPPVHQLARQLFPATQQPPRWIGPECKRESLKRRLTRDFPDLRCSEGT